MKTQRFNRSFFTRLAIAFCSVMMSFGLVAAPSFAVDMFGRNEPADSPTPNIMKDAEEFASPDKKPMSMEEVQARNSGGLNEIQGASDREKMINTSQPGKPDVEVVKEIDKTAKKQPQ